MDITQIKHLSDKAVDAALNSDYPFAITQYQKILTIDKNNIDAILGLAFAYLQINDIKNSKKIYKKALNINPTNTIAVNNLDRIKMIEKKGLKNIINNNKVVLDPNLFINIIGKTKIVSLTNIGKIDVIARLKIGEPVELKIKRRRVEIRSSDSEYIGALPDDVSKRMIYFLNSKSKYTVFIKSALKNNVEVFIKEIKKGNRVSSYISFPKNIQENLKNMTFNKDADDDDANPDREDNENEEEGKDEEVVDETVSGVNETDLDWLADNENFAQEIVNHKDEDSEEFEE